ncbi:MAG TPA: BTAD domain-containing putative transcriptional regulator [Marmoricola sp.]|nr:BTAD domain-containing putative transcriptional regulator [Marmoricola sp.]
MPIVLTLLGEVCWRGEPVVGERPQALLAALSGGHAVSAEQLVDLVWGDDVPANPAKALQVLVSRTRSSCGPDAVVRAGDGYRLGLPADEVDSLVLRDRTAAAHAALTGDPTAAAELAGEALDLGRVLESGPDPDHLPGPLAEVRRGARHALRIAARVFGQASSRAGSHDAALPMLEQAVTQHPDDEQLLADLLHSLAAVRGAGAALDRYESYRTELRDRLGTDPGLELRRIHQELLSLDSPVRDGLRYEATTLLGRGDDIRRLRAALVASRVVSIVGAGGLGKTRLAHVLGRTAVQPVVHFVELVGVTAGDDLVGEVGSALGVRDSVSGRRALTPEQRADVRARIAQHLDQAPSLLILDNCEHIVEAVADLAAYLVATTREVRVLTTTRAPLAIAAERVYALGELGAEDAAELFTQRAVASRPDVVLTGTEDVVAEIVERLDGLPLAIELAAAKVRVMSVADIAHRLENRFALLRGGDRSAPDRHQTLLAVIDWSWNLLDERERRALRWLSVFHDGFSLAGAEAMLGVEALGSVEDLTDQSLLVVVEGDAGMRYRMLETVREFGRMQLVDAGEEAAAAEAHRTWAVEFARRYERALVSPEQFAAVDAVRAEENNLADVLRQALTAADPATTVQVLATLGTYWMILGDHARIFVLAEAVCDVVGGWSPPADLGDATRVAVSVTVNNAMIGDAVHAEALRSVLRELGPGDGDPRIAAQVTIMQDFEPSQGEAFIQRLRTYAESDDRHLAVSALLWLSFGLENMGDPAGAMQGTEQALLRVDPADGPWTSAILHTQAGQLAMQLGRFDEAVVHSRQALPVLERLGAVDDAVQLRSLLALACIWSGDLDEAGRELDRLRDLRDLDKVIGGRLIGYLGSAELALARGDIPEGLAMYRSAVDRVRALEFPGLPSSGLEPWVLFGEATALAAYAFHADADDPTGRQLFEAVRGRVGAVLDPEFPYLDYPVCGVVLLALGSWGLMRSACAPEVAVRLLVLADRFAYNRSVPTLSWDRVVAVADDRAPGVRSAIEEEYGERRGPDLLEEARATVATLVVE